MQLSFNNRSSRNISRKICVINKKKKKLASYTLFVMFNTYLNAFEMYTSHNVYTMVVSYTLHVICRPVHRRVGKNTYFFYNYLFQARLFKKILNLELGFLFYFGHFLTL